MTVFWNQSNMGRLPRVVGQNVLRHVIDLKGAVYRCAGQVRGKTLLPLPIDAEQINEGEAIAREE